MLIVLLDESGFFAFGSIEEAVLEIEPIDAESELRAAFDESGVPYRPEWLRPNRRTKFLGMVSIEPGEYRFVPAGPPDRIGLVRLLEAHLPHTELTGARATLPSLLGALRVS
jgi:hypothetical protein